MYENVTITHNMKQFKQNVCHNILSKFIAALLGTLLRIRLHE
jgi:hypothetical protein